MARRHESTLPGEVSSNRSQEQFQGFFNFNFESFSHTGSKIRAGERRVCSQDLAGILPSPVEMDHDGTRNGPAAVARRHRRLGRHMHATVTAVWRYLRAEHAALDEAYVGSYSELDRIFI